MTEPKIVTSEGEEVEIVTGRKWIACWKVRPNGKSVCRVAFDRANAALLHEALGRALAEEG